MVNEITTTEKVQQKGNSLYILLRRELCDKLRIQKDDLVEIKIKKLEDKSSKP